MEKKASAQKFKAFMKKNVYYIIMAVCLLAIAGMVTATVLLNNSKSINNAETDVGLNEEPIPANGEPIGEPINNNDNIVDSGESSKTNDQPTINNDPAPIQSIVFVSPVEAVDISCDYSMDALVWNSTLKHYAVHNGIDFRGEDGANVYCVYDGVVTAVGYDVLNGYTITVQHNDTLYTSYGSLNEPAVKVGQTVHKGETIGTIGNTSGKEYSMGPHLHFSVYEDNHAIDPYKYMAIGGK